MLIRKAPQHPVEAGEDMIVGFRRPLTQVLTFQSQSDVSSEGIPASQTQFLPRRRCLGKQRTRAPKAMLQEFHRLEAHGAHGPSLTSKHPSKPTLLMQQFEKKASRLARGCTDVSELARPPGRSGSSCQSQSSRCFLLITTGEAAAHTEVLHRLFNVRPYRPHPKVSH